MISVIVPVYKVEPYLRECIDSILNQTYRDFELILVDDGSPDNCGAICDEYAANDPRVRVIHQENGGLSAARNAGLDVAKGEYVSFVDSDDAIHPECLSFLWQAYIACGADISIAHFVRFCDVIPSDGVITMGIPQSMSGYNACEELFGKDGVTYTVACGKLYKASLFSNIRYPVGRIHEDEATTYKLLYNADKVAMLSNALYFYRQNPDGIMATPFSEKRYDALTAFEERICYFREKGALDLAELGEKTFLISMAKMAILASKAGVKSPRRYRMPVPKALRIIRNNSEDENYTFYLSLVRPHWIRPHAYLRKIKKMLCIPCK